MPHHLVLRMLDLQLLCRPALLAFCGKVQLGGGLGASLAVGPLGRHAEAAFRLGTQGAAVCYSYSLSSGAFAGQAPACPCALLDQTSRSMHMPTLDLSEGKRRDKQRQKSWQGSRISRWIVERGRLLTPGPGGIPGDSCRAGGRLVLAVAGENLHRHFQNWASGVQAFRWKALRCRPGTQ